MNVDQIATPARRCLKCAGTSFHISLCQPSPPAPSAPQCSECNEPQPGDIRLRIEPQDKRMAWVIVDDPATEVDDADSPAPEHPDPLDHIPVYISANLVVILAEDAPRDFCLDGETFRRLDRDWFGYLAAKSRHLNAWPAFQSAICNVLNVVEPDDSHWLAKCETWPPEEYELPDDYDWIDL